MRLPWIARTGFLYLALLLTAAPAPLFAATTGGSGQPQSGPYTVGKQDFRLVDNSRTTAAHNGNPETAERILETTVWYPAQYRRFEWLRPGPTPLARQACPAPLVIYSHGLMSFRGNGAYLAEHLASHGYIVAAADFPLTRFGTAGGPQFTDVLNQPGDISFIIDSLLAWSDNPENRFAGCIDPGRIGAVGLSLGGTTTTLLAFHPEFRDPRIQAAVSIAGPVALLGKDFFRTSSTPFMMIAGDIDAMIDYPSNAAQLGTWVPDATLVTLHGGSHTGFAGIAASLFRWVDNPDSIGCWAMRGALDDAPDMPENFMSALRGQHNEAPAAPKLRPCGNPELPTALRPRHQQTLTKLAVFAFLQSHLHPETDIRHEYSRILEQSLALENPEVEVYSGQ
jgi:predicted dienelactone hydrolase